MGSQAVTAADDLSRYFQQLRQRGLFVVAEHYAVSRLADDRLAPDRRTDLVVELSRTLAEHAEYASPQQRDELWDRALQVVEDELTRKPLRAELLTAQAAFLAATRARALRWEVTVAPEDEPLRARWQASLTRALQLLEALSEQLEAVLKSTRRGEGQLALHEVRQLLLVARCDQGELLRDRAALRSTDDPERASDLVDAAAAFQRGQAGNVDPRIAARSQIGLADCARLQRDFERSRKLCDEIEKRHPELPPDLRDAVDVCRVRIWLDEDRPLPGAEYLLRVRQARHVLSGELWLVQLEALLVLRDLARQKGDAALVQNLEEEAQLALTRVAEQAGGSWTRLCHLLWDRDRSQQTYGPELDRLMRAARADYLGGRLQPALENYRRAYSAAQQARLTPLACELQYTLGSILLEQDAFAEAAAEFQALASVQPAHARTAAAHLLAAYSLGRLYDAQRTQSRRTAYAAALEQHLMKFADDATADDARFMLAQLEEQRLQASKALPLYLAIATDHARYLLATLGAARCQEQILRRLLLLEREYVSFQTAAVFELRRRVAPWVESSDPWTADQGEVVLRLVELQLHQSAVDYPGMTALLDRFDRARQTHADGALAAERWQALEDRALPLRMLALAGAGRSLDSRALLSSPALNEPARAYAVVQGLDRLTQSSKTPHFVDLIDLLLAVVERLVPQRERLAAGDRIAFDFIATRANLIAGRTAAGLRIATALQQQFAKDPARLEELARLVTHSTDRSARTLSLELWQQIERQTQAGSPPWLQARLGAIDMQRQLGDTAKARQLLNVTKLLYPQITDQALQQQLQSLDRTLNP